MRAVNMSFALFLLIKTGALFIFFSLSFVAASTNDGALDDNQPSRSGTDNIALGHGEQTEVIRRAREQFVGFAAFEKPDVEDDQQTADGGGSSFNFDKQALRDDDASGSPFSLPLKKRSVTSSSSGFRSASARGGNPLIEWPDASNTAADVFKLNRRRRTSRHRPLGVRSDGHKHWCHRDCESIKHSTSFSAVCGSDGRSYGSMCELKRHSCRHNVHLFRRSSGHCGTQMDQNETRALGDKERVMSSNPQPRDEVKIVELKGRCNRAELEAMKLLMLRQFGHDIEKMFKYFDANDDQLIEAHELWPRQDASNNNKSLYAQAWADHSNKCHLDSGFSNEGQQSKCWLLLDFAFEPQYPSNPCSLSHLILFDLKHPDGRFTFNTFQQAFQSVLSLNNDNVPDVANLKDGNKLFRRKTRLFIELGKSVNLNCLLNSTYHIPIEDNLIDKNEGENSNSNGAKCMWTRYDSNMAAKMDSHISVQRRFVYAENKKKSYDLTLHIKDAQLYMSGQFKCSCSFGGIEHDFEHIYNVQVLAEPRVSVRPQFQWSLPHSRISFECQYDHIDTGFREDRGASISLRDPYRIGANETDEANGQFGVKIRWLKANQNPIVDSKRFIDAHAEIPDPSSRKLGENDQLNSLTSNQDDQFYSPQDDPEPQIEPRISSSSLRASISMAASRLTLENLQLNDTGHHTCRVEVPINSDSNSSSIWLLHENGKRENVLVGEANGSLLVQEQPITEQSDGGLRSAQLGAYLWMFHDNGISVYKLQNDDGQEMELVKEINGHSLASGEVDGNWNQLTLCGGLNSEQVVICEWSDNAVRVDVNQDSSSADVSSRANQRKYVYVGQPNLNRIVVLDGLRFEIVAIVNTEPQPRKLHFYKPNKVHLSKWVRRRLSPVANARWLAAIGTRAHSLKSTPVDSRLYSNEAGQDSSDSDNHRQHGEARRRRRRHRRLRSAYPSSTNQLPSALIQHDIWLLCYGQPLVVDLSSSDSESDEDAAANSFYSSSDNKTAPTGFKLASSKTVLPFTPRITPPLMVPTWPGSSNRESRLRNRKSVHIIQSTFFPQSQSARSGDFHNHDEDDNRSNQADADLIRNHSETSFVGQFKRSSVLTTHHIFSTLKRKASGKAGKISSNRPAIANRMYLKRAANGGHQFDLLQDLFIPTKPYSVELNDQHKIHYAYVTHYNERRLFRVNMDEYRYDQEIDLENCDPINLVTTAQGLIVVQCRAPIAHNLIGQLVLDQLTSARIEFNVNIKAQESYLSPDNRYLISIHNNSTLSPTGDKEQVSPNQRKRAAEAAGASEQQQQQQDHLRRQASIVYVQLVTVSGLKLQYEIKTSLEMSQCAFVWKDGYYAAIFVSTNRRDQQSEILSLRLADSRLELMARVPGVISRARHKEQLIVSPELRLAAISTNQGTYVVDLEDNRVSQSLHHHQTAPTLLWV